MIAGVGLAAAAAAGVAAATGRKDTAEGTATGKPAAPAPTFVPPTGTSGSVFPGEGLPTSGELGYDSGTVATGSVGRSDAKPFDQTNGLVDTEGDSDGTAMSDTLSAADREAEIERGSGPVPPAGGSLGQH